MQWDKKVGVCVKSKDKTVIFQNDLCLKICGMRTGEKCGEACMAHYKELKEESFTEGIQKFASIQAKHGDVDAVVINDGESLITILYPLASKVEGQLETLKQLGLTKSELNVMKYVGQGMTNNEIAEKLFISKPTLRTHLNNIYKKIPNHLRDFLIGAR